VRFVLPGSNCDHVPAMPPAMLRLFSTESTAASPYVCRCACGENAANASA
jgi:hypothetical protein